MGVVLRLELSASGYAPLHHAREALRERPWVGWKLPVQDLGFIQQQVLGGHAEANGGHVRGGPVLNCRRERLSLQLCMKVKGLALGMQIAAGFAMFLPQSRRAFLAFFHGRLRCTAPLSPTRGTPRHPWPTCPRSQRTRNTLCSHGRARSRP